MKQTIFFGIIALFLSSGCLSFTNAPNAPLEPQSPQSNGISAEIAAQNLEIPWSLAFLPDGRLIFTERGGKVKIAKQGVVFEVKTVAHLGESGLQGIAVDPDFSKNNFVYLYYTYFDESKLFNRVSRFVFSNNSLESEAILLDKIPGNVFHDGGRIKFGPDGKLYASTGDAGSQELSQDKNSLAGKILRLSKDGSVPADNPFGTFVYSFGHRNPQGFGWHPVTGEMLATEHGSSMHDEINQIIKGANYGWPQKICSTGENSSSFVEAIVCFDSWTMAPSGAAFYSGERLPFKNQFIYGGLRGEQIRALKFENGKIASDEKLLDGFGRIRDIIQGPDGWLYFATNNTDGRGQPKQNDDKIYRIIAKTQ